jgi:hypothetical protein
MPCPITLLIVALDDAGDAAKGAFDAVFDKARQGGMAGSAR